MSMHILICLVFVLSCDVTIALRHLETPIREALLKPRNFNPHPYVSDQTINPNTIDAVYDVPTHHSSNSIFSQGPHQFPTTLRPGQNVHSFPSLNNKYEVNRVIDPFTYAFDNSLHRTAKKQYAFSYIVRDTDSGDDFSHTQQQKNGAVKGTYKVQLPDGRTQVVRYIADNDGYRADVSYLIDKNAVNSQTSDEYNGHVADVSQNLHSHSSIYPVSLHASSKSPHPPQSSLLFVTPPHDSSEINIDQRKSISAQPTYVVSAKSTQISNAIRIVPDGLHSNHKPYFKPPSQYNSFFYE